MRLRGLSPVFRNGCRVGVGLTGFRVYGFAGLVGVQGSGFRL